MRAPRAGKKLLQASAIVPVDKPGGKAPDAPPAVPEKTPLQRLRDWASVALDAEKVSARMAANGPAVRQLVFDPFVVPTVERRLLDMGVDANQVVILVGTRANPREVRAVDMWAQSVANVAAAFIPEGAGLSHPLGQEALRATLASVALLQALKAPVGTDGKAQRVTMSLLPPE